MPQGWNISPEMNMLSHSNHHSLNNLELLWIQNSHLFLTIYILLLIVCGIAPYDRAVWWAENLAIAVLVYIVANWHRTHTFSYLSYVSWHSSSVSTPLAGTILLREPFDWVTEFFNFERNHYDCLAHFIVGFYASPGPEIWLKRKQVRSTFVLITYPVFAIVTLAGVYEIFEWQYTMSADEEVGIAVLGCQSDV